MKEVRVSGIDRELRTEIMKFNPKNHLVRKAAKKR